MIFMFIILQTKQCFPEVYTSNTSTSSNYIDQTLEQVIYFQNNYLNFKYRYSFY